MPLKSCTVTKCTEGAKLVSRLWGAGRGIYLAARDVVLPWEVADQPHQAQAQTGPISWELRVSLEARGSQCALGPLGTLFAPLWAPGGSRPRTTHLIFARSPALGRCSGGMDEARSTHTNTKTK